MPSSKNSVAAGIERDDHVLARPRSPPRSIACRTASSASSFDGRLGRIAAFVADVRRCSPRSLRTPSSAWKISAPQRRPFGKRWRADRHHHELLHVDTGARGVLAAVENVHHRHRQRPRVRTAEVAVERQTRLPRPRPGRPPARRPGSRSRRAVPCSSSRRARASSVDADLIERIEPNDRLGDLAR